jgi:hypothetical protein
MAARRPNAAILAARTADRKLIEPGVRPTNGEPFRQLYERGVLGSNMPPYSRFVALALIAHGDPTTGEIPLDRQPYLAGLCRETGLQTGHVVVALNTLLSRGWLRSKPKSQRYETAAVQPAIPRPIMARLLEE